jgi:hypothetical protein
MHLTMINGYEFGQLLRILLWICVPVAMGILLVTTWLQNRRRQKFSDGLLLSVEGVSSGEEEAMASAYHAAGIEEPGADAAAINDQSKDDRVEEPPPRVAETFGEDDYKENLYKGILWMKDKYEQYRDMADQRYERLKDQLTKVEIRYEDLLASIGGSRPVVGGKPVELKVPPETAAVEPTPPAEPVGMESMTMAERVGLESIIMVGPARPEEPKTGEPRVEAPESRISSPEPRAAAPESRVWSPESRAEAVEAPLIDREERTHIQELEEQLARTRQRLEEELGRVRHQLEEEIARSRRQQDEQAAVVETNRHLEQQMAYSHRQLEEKQRIIADLEGQLRSDKQKIEELVTKIRNNGQLLMKIYQELDKSLHLNDIPKDL